MHHSFHPLYVDFCTYFNGNQDYFECHERLEEYWKEVAPGEKLHPLVGLIQLATGLYHWRRENFTGAARSLEKSLRNFHSNAESSFLAPFRIENLIHHIEDALINIKNERAFQSFDLPIEHKELQQLVQHQIAELPHESPQFLLHKHKLRDRSDVLEARAKKLEEKSKGSRPS
ncbi:DUF309 domain-containing protein [Lysinibacillus sp. 54212]|uniref:DUF309 domain-containing protein n=1 Tax=Lysinibacillus sp. 54212 TaxID=3119829 RepID=UPI002FC94CEF